MGKLMKDNGPKMEFENLMNDEILFEKLNQKVLDSNVLTLEKEVETRVEENRLEFQENQKIEE